MGCEGIYGTVTRAMMASRATIVHVKSMCHVCTARSFGERVGKDHTSYKD